MSKCVKLYKIDTYACCHIQLAKSEDGTWYKRDWAFHGYGVGYSSWKSIGQLSSIKRSSYTYENLNGNEIHKRVITLQFTDDNGKIDHYDVTTNDRLNASIYRLRLPTKC